jgi:hypothetical protein
MKIGLEKEDNSQEKDLKHYLNSTPQGPTAMPPRQGQFQFISPDGRIRPGGESSSADSSTICINRNS